MSGPWPARFYPLSARLARAFAAPRGLRDSAVDVIQDCPDATVDLPRVLVDGDDLDRVTGAAPTKSVASECVFASGGPVDLRGLTRYVFRDVLATPDGFFTAGSAHNQPWNYPRRGLLKPVRHLAAGFNALTYAGHAYFGHWLRECLASALLEPPGTPVFLPLRTDWPHARAYAGAAGIDLVPDTHVHFDEMSFADVRWPCLKTFEAITALHARLHEGRGESGAAGLYISRGKTGEARMLVNEEALIAALSARGFAIAETAAPLDQTFAAGAGVPLTVSMEGSHLMHALMVARRGAGHLVLNPADRFNLAYNYHARGTDSRLATVVVAPVEGGYEVDVDKVLRLLDRLESSL